MSENMSLGTFKNRPLFFVIVMFSTRYTFEINTSINKSNNSLPISQEKLGLKTNQDKPELKESNELQQMSTIRFIDSVSG